MHRGELLERIVGNSGMPIKMLVQKMGISRTSYYNHIKERELSLDMLHRYGRALGYDFSIDVPEIEKMVNFIDKPTSSLDEVTLQRDYWRAKYYDLLERHSDYLESVVTVGPRKKKLG